MTLEDVLKRIREHILAHPEDAQKPIKVEGADYHDWAYYKELGIASHADLVVLYGDGDPA